MYNISLYCTTILEKNSHKESSHAESMSLSYLWAEMYISLYINICIAYHSTKEEKSISTHFTFRLQTRNAVTTTSVIIKNKLALTPSMIPNEGSETIVYKSQEKCTQIFRA